MYTLLDRGKLAVRFAKVSYSVASHRAGIDRMLDVGVAVIDERVVAIVCIN